VASDRKKIHAKERTLALGKIKYALELAANAGECAVGECAVLPL
jgi:hypothetical protein